MLIVFTRFLSSFHLVSFSFHPSSPHCCSADVLSLPYYNQRKIAPQLHIEDQK